MQMRRKGQFCFVLTRSPRLHAFETKEYLTAGATVITAIWSEIIRVISNRTRAARSFDFEITRMISDQIALRLDLH